MQFKQETCDYTEKGRKLVHKLIHAVEQELIDKLVRELRLGREKIKKVNTYRKLCELEEIKVA